MSLTTRRAGILLLRLILVATAVEIYTYSAAEELCRLMLLSNTSLERSLDIVSGVISMI